MICFCATAQKVKLIPVRKQTSYGFMNTSGKVVIDYQFAEVRKFHEGLAGVKIEGKWGAINKKGKVVIACKYDYILDFSSGLAAVKINKKWGFINKKGKVIVPIKYKGYSSFIDGIGAIENEKGDECLINTKGEQISDWYDYLSFDASDRVRVHKNNHDGYLDRSGKVVIPVELKSVTGRVAFTEGLKHYRDPVTRKYGYMDKNGNIVIQAKYIYYRDFSEGVAAVFDGVGVSWKYIDTKGNTAFTGKFKYASEFKNGWASVVSITDQSLIINKSGQIVTRLPNGYSSLTYHAFKLISIEKDNRYCYIDSTGKQITDWYEEAYPDRELGLIFIRKDGKFGAINPKGEIVIPPIYDKRLKFYHGIAEAEKDGNLSYLDTKGNCIAGCKGEIKTYYERPPQTIVVGKNGNYPTLNLAVKDAENGDTIKVLAGTYIADDNIDIEKKRDLYIYGEGEVNILCSDYNRNVISLWKCNNIYIHNLNVRHTNSDGYFCAGNVFSISDSWNIKIEDCDINGCGARGVVTYESENITLKNNHIHNNSRWAVVYYETGLLTETDTLVGLTFEGNHIENNGATVVQEQIDDRVNKIIDSLDYFDTGEYNHYELFEHSTSKFITPNYDNDHVVLREGRISGYYQYDYDYELHQFSAEFFNTKEDRVEALYLNPLNIELLPDSNSAPEKKVWVNVDWNYGFKAISTDYNYGEYYYEEKIEITQIEITTQPELADLNYIVLGGESMHETLSKTLETCEDGDSIVLKSGTYDIYYPILQLKNKQNISITGDGDVQLVAHFPDTSFFEVLNCQNITINNIDFLSFCPKDEFEKTTNSVIYSSKTNGLQLNNCRFSGCAKTGVNVIGGKNIQMTSCSFDPKHSKQVQMNGQSHTLDKTGNFR
jgi:parallel beta-helix repeat protein